MYVTQMFQSIRGVQFAGATPIFLIYCT